MFKKYRLLYLIIVGVLLFSGCTPVAEQPYVPVETIVAATYAAISAQTAAARPPNTSTPLPATPTRRPSTITPTPTTTFVLPSFTPIFTQTSTPEPTATNVTSGSGSVLYACNILSLSPENVYQVKANQDFFWKWEVENIGTTAWDPDTVKITYTGGTQLARDKRFPLNERTQPGKIAYFKIKMRAPKEPGTYDTTWALRKDIHMFCYEKLVIEVTN